MQGVNKAVVNRTAAQEADKWLRELEMDAVFDPITADYSWTRSNVYLSVNVPSVKRPSKATDSEFENDELKMYQNDGELVSVV